MTEPEGQTARDIQPEDEGLPEVAQDDSPGIEQAGDPQVTPLPGERPGASADHGTTAFEHSQGESLAARLDRELPDVPTGPPAAEQQRATMQLEQDGSRPPADSGTDSTADDTVAAASPAAGGEGPEEDAIHPIEP